MKLTKINTLLILLLLTGLSSCGFIVDVFKTGMGVGIFLVILLVVVIVAVVSKAGKK